MTLEELIKEGNDVLSTAQRDPISSFVNESLYEPWKRKALMFVQENYPSHPQTKTFEDIIVCLNIVGNLCLYYKHLLR